MAPEADQTVTRTEPTGRRLDWMVMVRSPAAVWNVLILVGLVVVLSAIIAWARQQPLAAVGQVMPDTRIVRVVFSREDTAATGDARQTARLRAPRVYIAEKALLDEIRVSLENLPRSLADATDLSQVDPSIHEQFGLGAPGALDAVRAHAVSGGSSSEWASRVRKLDSLLSRTVLVDEQTFQRQSQAVSDRLELRVGDNPPITARGADVVNVDSPGAEQRLRAIAGEAGFTGTLGEVAITRLRYKLKPTFKYDQQASDQLAQVAADSVQPKKTQYTPGQMIVAQGDKLTSDQLDLLVTEGAEYRRNYDQMALAWGHLSVFGAALLAALGIGAYTATYAAWLWRAPVRMGVLVAMVALALLAATWIAAIEPRLINLAVTAPTLLVTVILAVAYDRRTALAVGSLLGILTCVALNQPVVTIGIALCGVWMAVWRLREFRQRNALIRAGLLTAMALGLATLLLSGLQRPMIEASLHQTLWDAAWAAIGAILVGFIALGLLPTIERLFDVTTGMSLIELRDPRHPLLRLLQQRAPGTYNHSLTVAGLAEAAAEAIKADGLLCYVGALYHDVGKSTKPEYFVENQTGGPSRHDKLAPAMSLLVIVGHVKEGIELAKEYNLPRSLHHFIESHHGTTLVEYFYHRARKQAEAGHAGARGEMPQEIEYRYPGPKPRSKEAAILMICDAAESATRTLLDPSPARIDSLVRAIAHKRLMDGQFDGSELTMRDLSAIVEAVSRSLSAIYHQRVQYPDGPAPAAPASGPRTASAGMEPATGTMTPTPTPATPAVMIGPGERARA